ncbi:hypothetical protein Bbelb_351570 [Branchiostoma belcheri]|nr:hypothetical protein Bbelb_351570 [Branchiostoma belcheri]
MAESHDMQRNLYPNNNNWSSKETRCLIGLWNNDKILRKLEQPRNRKVYDFLTQQLRKKGYNRTTKQVNKKIRDLKYSYRRSKETAAESRAGKRDWEFFEELDSFLGDVSRTGCLPDTRTEEEDGDIGEEEDVDFICDMTTPQGSSPLVNITPPKPNQNCSNWSSKETRCLIGLWNNDRVLRKLQQPRNKKVYNFLSQKLWEVGYTRTSKQVAKKIRDLKYSYRRSKETAGKSDWEFFEELDSFLGDVSRTDHRLDTRTEEDGDGEFGEEEDVDFICDVTAPLVDNTPPKPKGIWSSEEVRCLIGLWNNDRILCKLEQTRNKKAYNILTQQLRENGYNRTTKQVNKKIRDLKYFYRRNKETAAESRAGKRDWEFFEELDSFLGDACRLARLRDTRTEEDEARQSLHNVVPAGSLRLSKVGDDEHTDFVSDMTTLPHGPSPANQIGSIWTSEETHCLIGLWNNNRVLQELEPRWNKKGYELLSRRLRKAGYNRTAAQVNSKVKALKCRYRKHKETVTNSGPGKSDWEFFEELDSFLGDSSRTDRLLDTRTEEDEDGEGEVGEDEDVDFVSDTATSPHGPIPAMLNKASQFGSIWTGKRHALQEVGYNRTAAQVKSKVKAMKHRYRRHKETAGKSDWEFFEELDSFLGNVSRPFQLPDTRTEEEEDGEVGDEKDVDSINSITTSPHGPIQAMLNKANQFGSIWTRKETHCLIGLWNNDRVLRKLERTHCRKGYELLSRQLQKAGYNRTTAQVNSKVKALKVIYRRHKETAGKSDWEFFEELDSFLGDVSRPAQLLDTRTEEEESSSTQDGVHPVHLVDNTRAMDAEMVSFASNLDVESEGDGDSFVEMEGEADEDEGDSDSSICGLSKEVTLAVLPRLQLEELLVELRRRNVDMAGSNNRKNLVKVLHHLMVGEYAVEELKSITTVTKNVTSCNVKETASTKPMVWVVQPGASGNEKLMVAKNAQSLTQGRKRVTSSTRNTSGPMRAPVGSQSRNQPINTQKTKSMAAETTVHPGSASDKLKEIVDQVTRDLEGSQSNSQEGSRSSDLDRSQPDTAVSAVSSSAGNASSSSNPESLNRLVKQERNYQQKEMQEDDREKEYTDDSDNMDWDPEDDEAMSDDFSEGEDTADGTAQQEASWDTGGGDANSGTAPEDMPSSSRGGSATERIATPQKPPKFVMTREALKNPQLYYGTRMPSKKKRGVKKKCPYCPYLGDNRTLELHIRIHTGEKPFKCSMCDYSACQKANLDRHMLKHTGEKPFMCGECGYRTAYKCHLMPHMLEHAGSKPFVCEDCGYRTIRKSNLKRSVEIVKHMDYKHKDRSPDDHSPDHESAVAVSNIATVDHHSSAPSADLRQQPSSSSVQQVQVETQSNCNTAPEGSAFT